MLVCVSMLQLVMFDYASAGRLCRIAPLRPSTAVCPGLTARHGSLRTLQVGCGVGNAALPLLEQNPSARVFACDFSAKAVQLLKQDPTYDPSRITAFEADITGSSLQQHLPAHGVDLCTMLFVLSAIDPSAMQKVQPRVCQLAASYVSCLAGHMANALHFACLVWVDTELARAAELPGCWDDLA